MRCRVKAARLKSRSENDRSAPTSIGKPDHLDVFGSLTLVLPHDVSIRQLRTWFAPSMAGQLE